ncbi:MAG: hypothetical protein II777_03735 [Clostridia bacterium]|nr:hypothetical protein [Clostridia bacterium]
MKYGEVDLIINEKNTVSLSYEGEEALCGPSPVFRMRLTDREGKSTELSAEDAKKIIKKDNDLIFGEFPVPVTVTVNIVAGNGGIQVRAKVDNGSDSAVEWIVLLPLRIKPLCRDGGRPGTYLLFPYNEGALVDSADKLPPFLPEYPSLGYYMMFPNMMFSQFASYLYETGKGKRFLNVSAFDRSRGPKEIRVRDGELFIKLYCGGDYGKNVSVDYPVVFTFGKGGWSESAEPYKEWFEENPPKGLRKTASDKSLPDWYGDDVLVVSYPVRGTHDMDDPKPNALYPYTNALPIIDRIIEKTKMRVLVLLMHWEGTAPWAPPYVWPPYGGEDRLAEFRDELHKRNCMLGVYCSGFGYTERSNLVKEYDNTERIKRENLLDAMCAGPDGKVLHSRICPGQRSGYDICPETEKGREILKEAYYPLLRFGIDYAQILDQNHGGAQYLCYSDKHGHAPMPGAHATENMAKMLSEWSSEAGGMLLGCESSASEPFMGYLRFSDCRYELNYHTGRPVPLYAYMYHEYLRNFMGNQVSCPLPPTTDSLIYRTAYSFACGDVPSIILTPEGDISPAWGTRDFTVTPDKEEVLSFISALARARNDGVGVFLDYGKMIANPDIACKNASFGDELPEVIVASWLYENKRLLLMINPFGYDTEISVDGKKIRLARREIKYIFS